MAALRLERTPEPQELLIFYEFARQHNPSTRVDDRSGISLPLSLN
jgi:hypothetical protein